MKIRLHNFALIFTYSIQMTAKIKNWIRAEIWHIWRCFILFRIYAQNTGHSGCKRNVQTHVYNRNQLCALIFSCHTYSLTKISSVRLFAIKLSETKLNVTNDFCEWAGERKTIFSISLSFDILDRMQQGQNQQTNTRI